MVYLLRPTKKKHLEKEFKERPHYLLMRDKYYEYLCDGEPVGYIGLGHGVQHAKLLGSLFDCQLKVTDYYEIERSYCRGRYKNMPSKMLGTMLRMLRKYSQIQFVYTTGAGFQGLTGRIYQAANFLYIGSFKTRIFYLDGVGYLHSRSFNDRYYSSNYEYLRKILPQLKVRTARIFRYIYFLRNQSYLMKHAKFLILPYPKRIEACAIEMDGKIKRELSYDKLYDKIISLPVKSKKISGILRATSIDSDVPGVQLGEGGASPTVALNDKKINMNSEKRQEGR